MNTRRNLQRLNEGCLMTPPFGMWLMITIVLVCHNPFHVVESFICPSQLPHRTISPSRFDTISFSTSSTDSDVTVLEPPPTPTIRGRVNEIDFCMAPSDVSLSRAYATGGSSDSSSNSDDDVSSSSSKVITADIETSITVQDGTKQGQRQTIRLSLTRALNGASNRALRRILLARSWPSAEALNLSLRQVLASESSSSSSSSTETATTTTVEEDDTSPKCPVPRPILNIIMRRRGDGQKKDMVASSSSSSSSPEAPRPVSKRGRSEKEYVIDQINSFRDTYGSLPGYALAEAYLECILSLATTGEESPRIAEVLDAGVYDEPYNRFIAVLKSVGAVFEPIPNTTTNDPPLARIKSKLVDQDICLSMLDKIAVRNERRTMQVGNKSKPTIQKEPKENESIDAPLTNLEEQPIADTVTPTKDETKPSYFFQFWRKDQPTPDITLSSPNSTESSSPTTTTTTPPETQIKPEDLGGVLLSASEPTMTRQLNVLSNIVQRALLFGGDQELLVLSETLEADKPSFLQKWYPDHSTKHDHQPGVQYLNALILLLRTSYQDGIVTNLDPPIPLIGSYANAYERLMATLVELGSGYVKPSRTTTTNTYTTPKTPKQELGRFAAWEMSQRQLNTNPNNINAHPEDMVGPWEVRDEIGGRTIGITNVMFKPEGQMDVKPPIQGLRWRLDPGPTHLDTCTFQVLGQDGAVLIYKGFIDRGARLEARFSKRSITVRGSVMFQMRDGDSKFMTDDYRKDMLPIDYRTGTTRFVMTKVVGGGGEGERDGS